MFLRCHSRKKNGKAHRYFSIVESLRLGGGRVAQRQVLYLGEINDSQEAAWRKSIEVFDEDKGEPAQAALFPDDRPIPADEVNALSLVMYDLTSTYFEGASEGIPKARHGYSRDGRSDCRLVVIALVVTTDGLPMAYEVLAGNTADKTTLTAFLSKIQSLYGKARRVWVMDRGIPTEATLKKMRQDEVAYLVGTPKTLLNKLEKDLLDKPWEQVHEGMKVKLLEQDNELYVEACSGNRQKKENAMRRRKLKTLVNGLNRLKRRKIKRDYLLERLAVLKKDAGRIASFVQIRKPAPGEPVNRQTFAAKLDKAAWKKALDRDGCYLLRACVPWEQWPAGMERKAPVLWEWYMQLVRVEESFKTLKSDLNLRPIHHQIEKRVEAHILVAFLGYCLTMTLRMKLSTAAPGLTPRAALQSLSAIQMLEVHIPTSDGRTLVMPRYTEPEAPQQMILEKLKLTLPSQPPPRIRAGSLEPATETETDQQKM